MGISYEVACDADCACDDIAVQVITCTGIAVSTAAKCCAVVIPVVGIGINCCGSI